MTPTKLTHFSPTWKTKFKPFAEKKGQPVDSQALPNDKLTLADATASLQKKGKELRSALLLESRKAPVKATIAAGAAILATLSALPGATILSLGVAVGFGVSALRSKAKARKSGKELNQLERVQSQNWRFSQNEELSKQQSQDVLAVLQGSAEPSKLSDKKLKFDERYGPWAVITGATSGIGKEFAKQLSKAGVNPVLVARNPEKLKKVSEELKRDFGVEVRTISADLSNTKDVDRVDQETRDLNVGLLVNNAGTWAEGEFLENDVDKESLVSRLNVEAPMRLSSHFGKRLSQRGAGGILNVGSALAHVPTAYQANYAATKAYLDHFSKALAFEMRPSGVDVMIVNPGATQTEGTAHIPQEKMPIKPMSPEAVVSTSLESLGEKDEVIPGIQNKLAFGTALRMLPNFISTTLVGNMARRFMNEQRA